MEIDDRTHLMNFLFKIMSVPCYRPCMKIPTLPKLTLPSVASDREEDQEMSQLFQKTLLITIVGPIVFLLCATVILYYLGLADPLQNKLDQKHRQVHPFNQANSQRINVPFSFTMEHGSFRSN